MPTFRYDRIQQHLSYIKCRRLYNTIDVGISYGVMCDRHIGLPQSLNLQDSYKTGHGVWSRMLHGQLERRRENCTQLKCACCGGQEERQD